MTRIIPRSEWGARHRAGFGARPVGALKTYLHHSVTQAPDLVAPFDDDYAAVRTLENIGHSRFSGGISYTFAVTPAGLIFEGTGVGRVGAHTAGHNTTSAGIVLIGNYDVAHPPQAMLDAVAWLLRHGVSQGWWKRAALTGGHRDTKSTACPGKNAYARIGTINAIAQAGNVTPAPSTPPAPPAAPAGNQLALYGQRGAHVKKLQGLLGITADGIFGAATLRAVKAFQAANGLTVDGQVGALTWAKLESPRAPSAPGYLDVTGLQRLLGAVPDNIWGADTQRRFHAVRSAARFHGGTFPLGVAYLQRIIGVTADGIWGKRSSAAHDRKVAQLQGAMGIHADGIWGAQSEAAYLAAYNAARH